MKHCGVRPLLSALGLSLLAAACGGLAESRPRGSDLGPDIPLEPPPECAEGSCEPEPPEPGPMEPVAGRICSVSGSASNLTQQSEVDALEGCERITGSLTLRAFEGMNLSPLRSLRRVDGSLRLWARSQPGPMLDGFPALEEVNSLVLDGLSEPSLAGLARLQRVGLDDSDFSDARGRLVIRNSDSLRGLEGLEALVAVEQLVLRENAALTSVAGLSQVQNLEQLEVTNSPLASLSGVNARALRQLTLNGTQVRDLRGLESPANLNALALQGNPQLTSLQGAQLPERMGSVTLIEQDRLPDLRGLESLREVTNLIVTSGNPDNALSSLAGLESLQQAQILGLTGLPRLGSLRGLESLAEVARLSLEGLAQLSSLQGLSGLVRVGIFSLRATPALRSLAGLSSPNISSLGLDEVAAPSLEGLEGVTVSGGLRLANSPLLVSLEGMPRLAETASLQLFQLLSLTNIDAARGITQLQSLEVSSTSLPHLDAFADLRQVSHIHLISNPELTQVDGLGGLTSLQALLAIENAALRSLPTFAALDDPACSGCAGLRFEVGRNPQLQSGPSLPLVERADAIAFSENAQLTSLEGLTALRAVQSLYIEQNPSLLTLSLPALSEAYTLRIRYNAVLDDAPLDPLRSIPASGAVKIISNASGAAQLSPCPWLRDGECDEIGGDCSAGSDENDCRALGF